MKKTLPFRKGNRLQNFDYGSAGIYFITICTKAKEPILSKIVGDDVLDVPPRIALLPEGELAQKHLQQMKDFYEKVKIDRFVIMPNHIHLLLFVYEADAALSRGQHAVVSRFVSTFKRFCNKEWGENKWQRSFHDHIIRNEKDYNEHVRYLEENPLNWIRGKIEDY